MPPNRRLDQRLELHHFRAVDAIEAHGSLLTAAAALSVTQPALSRACTRIFIGVLRAYVGELAERGLADITIGTSER